MPKRPIEWAGVLAFLVVAILIAVVFDSPTSVWLLLVLVFVGVGVSIYAARRDGYPR